MLDGAKVQDQQQKCPVNVGHLLIQLHLVRITPGWDSAQLKQSFSLWGSRVQVPALVCHFWSSCQDSRHKNFRSPSGHPPHPHRALFPEEAEFGFPEESKIGNGTAQGWCRLSMEQPFHHYRTQATVGHKEGTQCPQGTHWHTAHTLFTLLRLLCVLMLSTS